MASSDDDMANPGVNDSSTAGKPKPDAAADAAAAREHGWGKPVRYDYDMYNASFTAPRTDAERVNTDGGADGMEARYSTTENVPAWGANTARYEWKEEYGDIGPAFKDLEAELFGTKRPEKAEYFNE